MQFANDAQRFRVGTLKVPGPLTGIKSRSSTAASATGSLRSTPYDGVTENVDVRGANAGPTGRQSGLPRTVRTVITQPIQSPNQKFAQIESQWTGIAQQGFGGNAASQISQMAGFANMQNLSISALGGNRYSQPDMTSEVPYENGISGYGGFGAAPNFFAKYYGEPGGMPVNWGLEATPRPSALKIDMPSPNPGANGSSSGFFQTTRDGTASALTQNPFQTINWQQVANNRVEGATPTSVNQPMVYAVMAALSSEEQMLGANKQFEETQHGQILFQAVEDLGTLRAAAGEFDQIVSPDKLPHSLFNVVSANWFLATMEDAAEPLKGWTVNKVLSLIQIHGAIRGDSSARFGTGERYGLARRLLNCNVGGGGKDDFVFNEWELDEDSVLSIGQELWYIIKRVPHDSIRATSYSPAGTFSVTGASQNVIAVPDSKTRNPFQIVPWIGKTPVQRPTRKDVEYTDDDGILGYGVAIKVGQVMQSDFPAASKEVLRHAGHNNYYRAQLPLIGIQFEGRVHFV